MKGVTTMNGKRIYNFSPGPGVLPLEVLEKCASEMTNYGDSGMSVMEMSHRSKVYVNIFEEARQKLRDTMGISDKYEVLFLQGGASTQFSMVPLNLMKEGHTADYCITGHFSKNAAKEAEKYGPTNIAFDGAAENYTRIPKQEELKLTPDASYVHICTNNTIYGTTWDYVPKTNGVPLVADMSSNILSVPVNVDDYGLIYAGAQKNMGPAGLTVVIIRRDLMGHALPITPTMLNYETMSKKDSMYNTPTTYAVYVHGLVLDWLKKIGGVAEMEKINRAKAKLVYDALDECKVLIPIANKDSRSLMNVTFKTNDPDLDAKFIKEAAENDLCNLKGHRSVGGMRASLYNAMPIEGCKKLADFIRKFDIENR